MSASPLYEFQRWLPAVVKDLPSVGLVVEYYVFDPAADAMVRKRVRVARLVKRIRSKRERLLAAQQVADRLNVKLREGWTPIHQSEDSRLYTRLDTLRERFLAAKSAEGCRPTTLAQYSPVTDLWLGWCEDNGHANKYSGTFLRSTAVCYMDDVLNKGNRHRSYNNTLKVMRSFFPVGRGTLLRQGKPVCGYEVVEERA